MCGLMCVSGAPLDGEVEAVEKEQNGHREELPGCECVLWVGECVCGCGLVPVCVVGWCVSPFGPDERGQGPGHGGAGDRELKHALQPTTPHQLD